MPTRSLVLWSFMHLSAAAGAQVLCLPSEVLLPVDSWQTVSGSYGVDGWAIYEVTMDLGVTYEFKTGCGDGATADHNTIIEWMTPVCTVINSNDDGCENGRSKLSFESFFSDGTVLWIRVRDAAGPGGSFTMAYRSIGGAPGECNECPSYDEELAPGSLWQVAEASYGPGACHVYRIPVGAGLTYDFKTGCGNGASADHDTRLEMNGTGCALLAADDDACELGRSSIGWEATANGIAYVKVASTDGEGGTFSLAYRRSGGNGSACGACTIHDFSVTPVHTWAVSSSSYLAGGCQMYRVSMTQGFQYTFKTGCGDGASADHDTRLELFNASCALVAEDDDGCADGASSLTYIANASGFMYLSVAGASGEEGSYSLAYRRSGVCAACPGFDQELTPGAAWQTASGSYLIGGCWVYRVNVAQGSTYVFQTQCGNGGAVDHASVLSMQDQACLPLTVSASGCPELGERVFFLAQYTGAVYLKVEGLGADYGAHTLAYRQLPTAADACGDAEPIALATGSVQLSGVLQDATSTGDFVPGSPLEGLPVKWYAINLLESCTEFLVSYCGQAPAWTNTLGWLAVNCPADQLLAATEARSCADGNVTHVFPGLPAGAHLLPLLYDPSNSVDGAYTITLSCETFVGGGIGDGSRDAVRIHPNPGGHEFWITGPAGASAPVRVRIADATGRVVGTTQATAWPHRVDAARLAPGLYSVHLSDGSRAVALRWRKE